MDVKIDKVVLRNVLRFSAIVAVGILVLYFYQLVVLGPKGKPTEIILQSEYSSIIQLANAEEVGHSSLVRLGMVSVGGDFVTSAKFQEIRDYYLQELQKHGWLFQGEKGLTVWGKDYGGKELLFEKGDYVLKLDYFANDPANYSFTYAIHLNWN